MKYIKDETSIETLNKILYKYVGLHADGMITTDELSDMEYETTNVIIDNMIAKIFQIKVI